MTVPPDSSGQPDNKPQPTQPQPNPYPSSNQYSGAPGYQYDPAAYYAYYQQPPQPYQQPMPPQQRREGGFKRGFGLGSGAGLGAGLMLAIFGTIGALVAASAFAALVQLGSGGATTSAPLTTVWGSESASKHLRSIEVNGVILGNESDGTTLVGGTYGYEIAQMIDDLGASDADGLILDMNTPGGTIYGSRAIADAVDRYKQRTGKKVVAYVRGMSASGGMYAMAGADQIFADHGTMVGSIGVIMGPIARYKDVTALQSSLIAQGVVTKGGITEQYLTQGKGKDFGNPFRDMTPEERAVFMKGLVNEYNAFVDHVAANRKIPAATIKNDLGAHLYDPKTAITKKLVDKQLGQEEAYREAASLGGLDPDSTNVQREEKPGFLDSLLGADSSRVRGQAPPAAGVDGKTPVATSYVCTGRTVVLAYAGDKSSVCG
ncbi:MAG: S49 family peptidase [Microlunatus sp.]|nr:S49 family peptidase [Microlunatus sp.]